VRKAQFEINGNTFTVEFDDNETSHYVFSKLPLAGNIQRWGDEIFFDVPFIDLQIAPDAKTELESGDIAMWTQGSAIAIFFGPTPISHQDEIRSEDPVNVFGKVIGDLEKLKDSVEGDFIYITPLE
jgi:hypothetical protein